VLGAFPLHGLQLSQDVSEEPGRYPCLAAQRTCDHRQQVLDRFALSYPAGYADPHSVGDQILVFPRAHHDDPQAGVLAQGLHGESQTVGAAKVQIEQHDVEVAFAEHPARIFDGGRRHRAYPGLLVEPADQRLGEDDVVIKHE